uniref:Phosphatidylethanolamine-binding protein n=1 Tax=Panagrellus redivivus TaxID=6233 RepID=A0A7E4W060_PANRE
MRQLVLFFVCLFTTLQCAAGYDDIEAAFRRHKVVKDVIGLAPPKLLKVAFDSGSEASLGNILTPNDVKNAPIEVSWPAKSERLYTLVMIDPDAPSRANPSRREFLHWLVVNIPGGAVSLGDTLAEYVGAGPPEGTGLHRYVFIVYLQDGRLTDYSIGHISKYTSSGRPMFMAQKFADKHELGAPIAGNFYQAMYDSYVPILHRQMSQGNN